MLWAFYMVKRTQDLGHALTVDDLTMDFPNGFPTEEGYTAIWDAQKGYNNDSPFDNVLDMREPWSIAAVEPVTTEGF